MLSVGARNKLGVFSDGSPDYWKDICALANSGEISRGEFFYAFEPHLKNVIGRYERMKANALPEELVKIDAFKKDAETALVELCGDTYSVTYRGYRICKNRQSGKH